MVEHQQSASWSREPCLGETRYQSIEAVSSKTSRATSSQSNLRCGDRSLALVTTASYDTSSGDAASKGRRASIEATMVSCPWTGPFASTTSHRSSPRVIDQRTLVATNSRIRCEHMGKPKRHWSSGSHPDRCSPSCHPPTLSPAPSHPIRRQSERKPQ
jgi:hypothetical protein